MKLETLNEIDEKFGANIWEKNQYFGARNHKN